MELQTKEKGLTRDGFQVEKGVPQISVEWYDHDMLRKTERKVWNVPHSSHRR